MFRTVSRLAGEDFIPKTMITIDRFTMAQPELGSKRICVSCGARFYDLNKEPAVCPKCGAEQPAEVPRLKRAGDSIPALPVKAAPKPDKDGDDIDVDTDDDDDDADVLEDTADLDDDADDISTDIDVNTDKDEHDS
ncbi:hypothetical protein AOE01nite_02980 [Acetobacter oeni]|uniref:TIGR02300 family protein n=2 Tax=Acetobacter oeni TaxID=304077 RepID=A0A511XGJ1_9PROT|nr:hypothetical protein AOE01nite_02980 [Acetobacter oeni]